MKQIPLNVGHKTKNYHKYFALVDDEDFEKVNQYKWHWKKGYARGKHKLLGQLNMAKMITNCPNNFQVDHINRNTLDNRKCNLRICSAYENTANRKKRPNQSSKYIGVKFKDKIWSVHFKYRNKDIWLGSFKTELQCAMARDIWVKDFYGEFANLNFNGKEVIGFK